MIQNVVKIQNPTLYLKSAPEIRITPQKTTRNFHYFLSFRSAPLINSKKNLMTRFNKCKSHKEPEWLKFGGHPWTFVVFNGFWRCFRPCRWPVFFVVLIVLWIRFGKDMSVGFCSFLIFGDSFDSLLKPKILVKILKDGLTVFVDAPW